MRPGSTDDVSGSAVVSAPTEERDPDLAPDVREDRYLGGTLHVLQRERGYRSSIDALLLVHEALRIVDAGDGAPQIVDAGDGALHVVDAGAGCGVIALMLATLRPALRVSALEVQPSLLVCCRAGIRRNGLEERVAAYGADLRDPPALPAADLVVMNPPFFAPGRGRLAPDAERAAARHQLHGDIDALVAGCARLLHPAGTLLLVYPARQREEALRALERAGLSEIALRPVQTGDEGEARLLLVHARAPAAGALRAGASMDGASLDNASMDGASQDGASMEGAALDGAALDGTSLDGTSMDGASKEVRSRDGASPSLAPRDTARPGTALELPPLVLHVGPADSAGRRPYVAEIRRLIDGGDPTP